MEISVEQWRAALDCYNVRKSCSLARSFSSSQFLLLLSVLCFIAAILQQAVMSALMLLILLSGDVERNPGPDIMDLSPTLSQLTHFPGKTRQLNIAVEIGFGIKCFQVGKALLNDKRGFAIASIVSKYSGDAEQINMEALRCWVQGKGMPDHTWRGLLNVLRVHCPGLAQDIEDTLRAEEGSSAYMHDSLIKRQITSIPIQPSDSATAAALEVPSHATPQPQSGETAPKAGDSCTKLKSGVEASIAPIPSQSSDSVTTASHRILNQASQLLAPTQPPHPLSKPSLEECFSIAGIPADCVLLDKEISDEEHIADIANELTRWKELAPYFRLKESEVEEIEAAGSLTEQKKKLLTKWIRKFGSNATYRNLCTILWKQNRLDLIEAVCILLQPPLSTKHQLPPTHHQTALPIKPSHVQSFALNCYRDYLRAVYTRTEIPDLKWPPSPGKKFINLAVISKEYITHEEADEFTRATLRGDVAIILNRKAPIELKDILKVEEGEKLKCVLVEGVPGVGKSTLAWHICQEWGKGELYQEYSIVLLLQLRDARVQAISRVEELFHYEEKVVQAEAVQEIIKSHGENILIILDGLDELPSQLLLQPTIFTSLLSGTLLPHSTVMVTSRPSATYKLWKDWRQQISQHIEIIGFTEKNIMEYVQSVLPSHELPHFQDYLSIHSHIKLMMYVPLHCAIVTIVYLECQTSHTPPPRTLTGLYTCLTQTILIRYLDNHPDYRVEDYCLENFSDLPQPVYHDFRKLCQIAFEGVNNQKQIFYDLGRDFNHLGFMTTVPELSLYQQSVSCSHNFLHFSVQEFLAAYHVSLMTIQEQEQLLQTITFGVYHPFFVNDHRIAMFQYLAGITQFIDLDKAVVRKAIGMEEFEAAEICLPSRRYEVLQFKQISRFLCEAQNVNSFLNSDSHYELSFLLSELMSCSHHDLFAMGYCIANSCSKWTLELYERFESNVDYSGLKAFAQQLKKSETYTVEKLIISDGYPYILELILPAITSLKTLEMKGIVRFPPQIVRVLVSTFQKNQSISELSIKDCHIDSVSLAEVLNNNTTLLKLRIAGISGVALSAMLKHNTTLKELDLTGNIVSERGALALAEMLKHSTTLRELNMTRNSLGDRGALAMAEMLKHNTTLRELNMSRNSVGDRGALVMAEMIKCNTGLRELDMNWNCIGERGALAMAEMFKYNTTLRELGMSGNCIGTDAAIAMAENLKHNTALRKLDMSQNAIDEKGTKTVAELLKGNTLTELNLSRQSVTPMEVLEMLKCNTEVRFKKIKLKGDESAIAIAVALRHNTTVEVLDTSSSKIGERGVLAMAELLKYNTTLRELNLSSNEVSEKGALTVAEMLKHNTTLRKLNMSKNGVGERGALAMAEMLKHNTTLRKLNMSWNKVSERGALAIAEMLKYNTALRELDLSWNSVSDRGGLVVANMFKCNTTLRKLDMSHNSIGNRGAWAMAEMLKHNTTLRGLDMSWNKVGERGALAMVEMLKHNTTLRELNMRWNSVGDEGALGIAEMLKQNTSLEVLDIETRDYHFKRLTLSCTSQQYPKRQSVHKRIVYI